MFYDLNVQWTSAKDPELPRTLAFLAELGYDVVALNYNITGKLPADLTCQIPTPLPFTVPKSLTIFRRCTLHLTAPLSNARLTALANNYDLLALRPIDEKTLQNACSNLDCDIISLDLSQRLPYHFKFKTLAECVKRGIRLEINYAQAISGDAGARRNVISNATALVRASRGRGLVVASEARRAVGCRGPWDVVNLASIWGLSQDRAYEAVSKEARFVVVSARLKRTGFRGVVDIVHAGEKSDRDEGREVAKETIAVGKKRKAEEDGGVSSETGDKAISKREQKRRNKVAREQATSNKPDEQASRQEE